MDWGANSQLFAEADDFICDNDPQVLTQTCVIHKNYQHAEAGNDVRVVDEHNLTLDPGGWDTLVEELNYPPKNGYCIMFIPRAADVEFPGSSVPSDFTSLPISAENWDKVLPSLYLPRYYANVVERGVPSVISIRRTGKVDGREEGLFMQIGTTNPTAMGAFAFASTHFELRRFTSAIIVGCSHYQIKHVTRLLSTFKHSIRHPLLMLGIFAELELRRLEDSVNSRLTDYNYLREELQDAAEKVGATNRQPHYLRHNKENTSKFSWGTIKKFLTIRDQLQDTEEEVEASKRQLDKVCRQVDELWEEHKRNNNQAEEARKENLEVTQIFSERFHDIVSRLDAFSSQLRLRVESISFWTDFTRSEFARQEANISAQNAKIATLIAFVALVYLPITGVATILAMPIFGWTNDWKNLLFQSVAANEKSNGGSTEPGSAGATNTGLPVVSGYIWVYISISAFLLIITLMPFAFAIRGRMPELQAKDIATVIFASPKVPADPTSLSGHGGATQRRSHFPLIARRRTVQPRVNGGGAIPMNILTGRRKNPQPDDGRQATNRACPTPEIGVSRKTYSEVSAPTMGRLHIDQVIPSGQAGHSIVGTKVPPTPLPAGVV